MRSTGRSDGRIWIVSELYHPEETSTGYILTRIAEYLAQSNAVSVLCSQPTYRARGIRAASREVRTGVSIERVSGTTFEKNSLLGRSVNMLTISCSLFVRALERFRADDIVIVVTNPPLLPFLTAVAARIKGSRVIVVVHDVYPEVLVASGLTTSNSMVSRAVGSLTRRLYRSVDRVVAIGRDMEALIREKLPPDFQNVVLITNWADVDAIIPGRRSENRVLRENGLGEKLVIQYAGNMGRSHDIESIIAVAEDESVPRNVVFLFVGDGAKRRVIEKAIRTSAHGRIRLLPSFPRDHQSEFLNACDVAIISFVPGMKGISVPSRMYNILAAGKPILAVTDRDTELALVINEHRLGWVVPPGDRDALLATLRSIATHTGDFPAIGARARSVAERLYAAERVLSGYKRLVADTKKPLPGVPRGARAMPTGNSVGKALG